MSAMSRTCTYILFFYPDQHTHAEDYRAPVDVHLQQKVRRKRRLLQGVVCDGKFS